jgi:hypothetical protein
LARHRRRPGQAGPLSSRPRRPGSPGMCGSGGHIAADPPAAAARVRAA